MEFDKKKIENSTENLESNVESLQEQNEILEQRESRLDKALTELEQDEELQMALEKNELEVEIERQEFEEKRFDAVTSLNAIQAELEQLESENNKSDSALEMLRMLGEDVSESNGILEKRYRWLEECKLRIQKLAELLGEDYEKIGSFSAKSDKTLSKAEEEIVVSEQNAGVPVKNTENNNLGADEDNSGSDPFNAYSQYMMSHNYSKADFPVYSKDPEWRRLFKAAYPDYKLPPLDQETAKQMLQEYMFTHNYGKIDFPTYSKDPEWRRLVHAAYPSYELPPLERDTAKQMLQEYMYVYNYTRADFGIYSKDPEWQYLEFIAYPENITPVKIWAKSVNPNYKNPSLPAHIRKFYQENCGSCAFAMEQHFNGNDLEATASSKNIPTDEEMESITGKRCVYMSPKEIEKVLLDRGAGAHLIIGIDRYNPITKMAANGHWFNAYYDGSKIHTVDGQTGKIYDWPHDYGYVSRWCAMI